MTEKKRSKKASESGESLFFTFSDENQKKVKEILAKYPEYGQRSAVMPLLYLAQEQNGGWISIAAMDHIGEILDMAPIRVYEVATFYTMYNKEPVGEHHIQICGTTPCWLRGSDELVSACKELLNIEIGETTSDGKFTLTEVECLGACANAPMVQINNDYFEDLTAETMTRLLHDLKGGKKVKIGPQIDRQYSAPQGMKHVFEK